MQLTHKQQEAVKMLGTGATHCLLFGGSRSGKTAVWLRAVILRALAAPKSRHAVLRYRFNHVKSSIVLDTFPKVLELAFPGVKPKVDKTDWYAEFPNGSQIWFGGLDDKERTEKILGQEHCTIFLNECSQIPFSSRNMALTRLAQSVEHTAKGKPQKMRLKMLYDCNPPGKGHWTYQLFVAKRDPSSKLPVKSDDYAWAKINPADNLANLPGNYLDILASLPAAQRLRFLEGMFADDAAGALWQIEQIEGFRHVTTLPDLQRVVIAVDPSGARDIDNAQNDSIGIVAAGLGVDGNGYLLEDATVKASPAVWGRIATDCYERHNADAIVGEENFGGAMVEHVIQTARPRTPYRVVRASRGKVVRAEPIAALAEKGKIRHAGNFPDLEDELCNMTTHGYIGEDSPNRADAYVWAFTDLFGGIVNPKKKLDVTPIPTANRWS